MTMIVVFAAAILMLSLSDPHRPASGIVVLDRAQEAVFSVAGGDELWRDRDVKLSQNWHTDTPLAVKGAGVPVEGRYHLRLDMFDPVMPAALMIARISQAVRVEIEGIVVHDDHDGEMLKRWNWYSPVVVALPDGLLRAGGNALALTVTAAPGSMAGLSRIFVGEADAIERMALRLHFLQKQLPTYANVSVIVLSIPLLLIWLHGRRVAGRPFRIYGLLAAASVVFAVRSMHVHVVAPPLPHHLWLPLVGSSLGWALGFFFSFMLHLVGAGSARTDRALALFVSAGTLLLFLLPTERFTDLATLFWYVPLAAVGAVCIGVVCFRTLRSPDSGRVGLSLSLLLLFTAGIHDVSWARGVLPFESLLWMPLVMPAVLLAISAAIANRFVRAWVAADALSRDLATRVQEAEAEIVASYERRLAAERRETLAAERAKLVEDLHDGVGSRLSVLLAALHASPVPRERMIGTLGDCLGDLRMIITARDRGTLGEALAELHGQMGALLEAQGIDLFFRIDPQADALRPGPREMLDLLRLMQEACANAARHGRGDSIGLECFFHAPGMLRFVVSDGGDRRKVVAAMPPSSGRGIATMQARAERIGATLVLAAGEDGWRVTLDMPVQPSVHPPAENEPDRTAGADAGAEGERTVAAE